ncbi:MAG: peptide-methionine (R)-S-oxide reductase [Litoreibacter sp.]|nr:peptide-methionine (R)-S-oxide reductase [Litoreibacter sp.]
MINRRAFIASGGAAALASPTSARVAAGENIDYAYEVTRTEAEWLERLTDEEFVIMREGFTEARKSSPLWEETRPGEYLCKGCDLKAYDGRWKTVLDIGWVFFLQSEPGAVMMNIDGPTPDYGAMSQGLDAVTEVHCRRCGSHFGHLLIVEGRMRHCINGASLTFRPV